MKDDKFGELQSFEMMITDYKKVVIREVNGQYGHFVDIRQWVRGLKDIDFVPTKRGVMIPFKDIKERLIPILDKVINGSGSH